MEATRIQTWDEGHIRDIPVTAMTTKREMRAKLGKLESALVAQLLLRANDVSQSATWTGRPDAMESWHSPALNITIESGLESVAITEHGGFTIEWTDTPAMKFHGRTHSRGYDRVLSLVAEAALALA